MFHCIEDATAWVTGRKNHNLGFLHFKEIMNSIGNPQDCFKTVHVAGTNGKGSTSNAIAALLGTKYKKIGLFTSPHLVNHRDRIRLNGTWIPEDVFLTYINEWYDFIVKNELNMFEIDMLVASLWYKNEQVDYAIFEVGLGGRLDSTNVLNHPELCVITTIGFDHMDRLGNTISEIAGEKAGILKTDCPALLGYLNTEASTVIETIATEKSVPVMHACTYQDKEGRKFELDGQLYEIHSYAGYQKNNMSLALQAVRYLGLDITSEEMIACLKQIDWAGRFEIVSEHPLTILDGAHNEEGVTALVQSIRQFSRPIITVFSALRDKHGPEMEQMLEAVSDHLIVTEFMYERADTADHLRGLHAEIIRDYQEAIRKANELAGENGTVIITGSLYFVSIVRDFFAKDGM